MQPPGLFDFRIADVDGRTCDHNFGPGNVSGAVTIKDDRTELLQPLGHQ